MFAEERQKQMLLELHRHGKLKVRELSDTFKVTEDCIRKDLKVLENAGKLKRTYGGAILSQDYPLQREVVNRKMIHQDEKRMIAEKAYGLVKEGDCIFLDVSTANIQLAELIAMNSKKLLVVSNMIDILQALADSPHVTAVGTGGTMHTAINGFMGVETCEAIRRYSFDRAFLGCCGIDMTDAAITTLGAEDGLTKKTAIQCARHPYVVMENQKFYYNECYKYAHLDDIDGVITDQSPNEEMSRLLDSAGVKVF